MPRGVPKPQGACERIGCYDLAFATVTVWHDHVGGYRQTVFDCCRRHATEYEYAPGQIPEAAERVTGQVVDVTDLERQVRAMTRAERHAYLRAYGWRSLGGDCWVQPHLRRGGRGPRVVHVGRRHPHRAHTGGTMNKRTTPRRADRCVFCEILQSVDHLQQVTIPSQVWNITPEDRDYAHRLAVSIARDANALQELLHSHGYGHQP